MADAERSEGTATATATDPEAAAFDYDVAIVGGGPTGCSAGVFTGRYGLDTVVFDRGRSSLQRCAYLENYLGFPGGVDVETFYGLIHDHVEAAGCDLVPELVEAVEPAAGDETETADAAGPGFEVTTQDGETVTARRVVAAARYGGDFLEPLGDDEMFITYEYDGETRTKFDRDYADVEGRTAIDGLYVAAPVSEVNVQAIMSAGQGARVGRSVITDHRLEQGYPEDLAAHWDWIRPEAELADEETARDDWRERFDSRVPDDCDLADERLRELREADVERQREMYVSEGTVESRAERGRERLADHLGVDADSGPAADSASDSE
ncbi:thioredoxin reductase [Haloferax sp. Atlit-6N]|uniref:NAD(P)/FAD-dependent oxidoreductase n=1 Tax=unclassified Haloferax TaxID=2625095 RepID=UPI000E23BD27|nr:MULTISPECIES: NAD(P)/FAD-dependent oxidoreductase [unclassified Haloferax]RDZ55392.1 thioredoxin reductase [Haloferax sp. Atlit-4N]REA04958.1 thioredoxin reductase [Haloferax sp. Atlit-6N]